MDLTPEKKIEQSVTRANELVGQTIGDSSLVTRAAALMEHFLEQELVMNAINRLHSDLPAGLHYHNLEHTIEVMNNALLLALQDELPEKEIELLAIAAAYHDTGFVDTATANEPIGARYAREAMLADGYSEEDVQLVETMILDTQLQPDPEAGTLKQVSHSRLSNYLLDADVNNFGRATFFENGGRLLREFTGKPLEEITVSEVRNFMMNSEKLIRHHNWHSEAAQTLFSARKAENERIATAAIVALQGIEAGFSA